MGLTFFSLLLDVLASPYLFANQKALITADQKNYIINIAHAGSQLAACLLQIVLLITTRSFILYRGKNRLPGRGRAGDFPAYRKLVSGYLLVRKRKNRSGGTTGSFGTSTRCCITGLAPSVFPPPPT